MSLLQLPFQGTQFDLENRLLHLETDEPKQFEKEDHLYLINQSNARALAHLLPPQESRTKWWMLPCARMSHLQLVATLLFNVYPDGVSH